MVAFTSGVTDHEAASEDVSAHCVKATSPGDSGLEELSLECGLTEELSRRRAGEESQSLQQLSTVEDISTVDDTQQ